MTGYRPWSRALAAGSLVLAAALVSLFLFPADSDGAFASFDGVVYGMEAEGREPGVLAGAHPLFHTITPVVASALRAAGVPSPGPTSVRVLAGMGAAALLLLVATASGVRRWVPGIAFALALFATRGFLTLAAVGETILPACAAALWTLHEATRTPLRTYRVWVALAIALMLRADNILIVPGVAVALWMRPDGGARPATIAKGLCLTGIVTVAGYITFWWTVARGRGPITGFFFPRTVHDWTGLDESPLLRLATHVDSWGAAVVGRTWPLRDPNIWIGPAFVALLLAAAFLLRGNTRVRSLWPAIVLTIVIRAIFFSWYDVTHPKWSVLTLSLIAYLGARLAEGEPRWPLGARVAGVLLLAASSLATSIAHGPFTLRLRDRRFIGAMTHAVDEGRNCRVLALGPNVNLALDFLSVPHTSLGAGTDLDVALPGIIREVQAHPESTLIVYERWTPWIVSGDPYMMTHPPAGRLPIDDVDPTPEWRLIRWEGLAYAARYDPKMTGSPPSSRPPMPR